MSDELAVVEGVMQTTGDAAPFASEAEAERFMTTAMGKLRDSYDMQQEAKAMLIEAQAREAHRLLGFETWEDCLASKLADTFHVSIPQAKRIPIVAQLRLEKRSTKEIAEITGTSHATATRDLQEARRVGYLDEEPQRVMAGDGRPRLTSTGQPEPGARQARRQDFGKTFRNRMADLDRVYRALLVLRADDRYKLHLSTLAATHGAFLSEVLEALADISEDFVLQDGEQG